MPTAPQRAKSTDGTTDMLAVIQLEWYELNAAERKGLDLMG